MIKVSYQLDPYEMLYLITNILCLLLLWILIIVAILENMQVDGLLFVIQSILKWIM